MSFKRTLNGTDTTQNTHNHDNNDNNSNDLQNHSEFADLSWVTGNWILSPVHCSPLSSLRADGPLALMEVQRQDPAGYPGV